MRSAVDAFKAKSGASAARPGFASSDVDGLQRARAI
jgi:hypothetical protein